MQVIDTNRTLDHLNDNEADYFKKLSETCYTDRQNRTWNHGAHFDSYHFSGDDFSREITQAVKERFSTKYYPLLATLAGVSFALHNLFFYQTTTFDSLAVVIPYWIGIVPILSVFLLVQALKEKKRTGSYWSKEHSKYFNQDGSINRDNLTGLLIRTFLAYASMICFYFTLSTCHKSDVNLAVIISITAIAAVFTAIVFQILFNEMMQLKHWIGMLFLLSGVIIISQSQNASHGVSTSEEGQLVVDEPTMSVWFPIMCALIGAIFHTSISVTGRIWMMKGISSFELTTDAFFLQGVTLMIANVVYVLCGGQLPLSIMIWAGIGSAFNMTGFFLCTEASVYGKAGPSQALMELQSIFQLTLEIIIFGRIPNLIEISGMTAALLGTFVIAVGGKN